MSFLRLFIRTIIFGVALLAYFVVALVILALTGFNFSRARVYLIKLISVTSMAGLKLFGVQVRKNFQPLKAGENYLIVANHLSYLDVLIISSFFPTCFVTSTEMKETPFLGQLCLLGGCLFVERRKRARIAGEVAQITHALKSGLNVVIFPEAKSTNGEAVIAFKRPLFQAAVNAGKKVLPLCLNYRTLDGEKLTVKNRDKIFWYGNMSFLSHALDLFSHQRIVADLSVLECLDTLEFSDKNTLADKSFEVIANEYQVISHA